MLIKNSSDIRCVFCKENTDNQLNGYPICHECIAKHVLDTDKEAFNVFTKASTHTAE